MGFKLNAEQARLKDHGQGIVPPWHKWGPYVSERSWGTVREDYSADGDSWAYFPFEQSDFRAYRWGEDGIAGLCDRFQVVSFAHSFWNHNDCRLKERIFGLSGPQGNHGEDCKEYYYYLDNTPSHSYMKYLYKYPQGKFPYDNLVEENGRRGCDDREYELVDTGVFDEGRYFDIFIEYAKISPDDVAIRIEAINRGPDEAVLDIIPQITFRNLWSWDGQEHRHPELRRGDQSHKYASIVADDADTDVTPFLNFDYHLGKQFFYGDARAKLLFTNNETNTERLNGNKCNHLYTKDAFHRHIVNGED